MPSVNVNELEFEGIHLVADDFTAGKDEGDTLAAGSVGEVATAEVTEDGQLSSYDAVLVGDELGPTGNSSKGKMFIAFQGDQDGDGTVEAVPDDTQFRLVARDKNSNRRIPLTRWFQVRGEDNADPRLRTELLPREPAVKNGRIIGVEAKRESGTVVVSLADSTLELPARGGY